MVKAGCKEALVRKRRTECDALVFEGVFSSDFLTSGMVKQVHGYGNREA